MRKERVVIERILNIINADDFQVGSALPSERKLASTFNASRNTIRTALRQLEARGFIDVRRGSGYFLLCKDDRPQTGLPQTEAHSLAEIQGLFEARYLFEPAIGALSARRIGASSLAELEKCLIRLSRAIIGVRIEAIISEDVEFRKIIASGTGNRAMVAAIHQLRATNRQALAIFSELSDEERDALFAEYVAILNALKKHNPGATEALIRTNILRCCAFAMKYTKMDMPELIVEAIERSQKTGVPVSRENPHASEMHLGEMTGP